MSKIMMNKTIIRGRLFVLLATLFALGLCSSITAQIKRTKSSKLKKPKLVKKVSATNKKPRIVSLGVINGHVAKPDDLVKPNFPSAARISRAAGSVYVRVLIDEEGRVAEAKATFGHPLLRPAAINAARKSKFKPIIIGGASVKVSGIIVYNFVPESFNWLEIGYILQRRSIESVYSMKNLTELLTFEFEAERQLLLMLNDEKENNDSIILSVRSAIEGKLADKAKERWLFSIGGYLSKLEMSFQYKDEQQQTLFYELRFNVQNMPEDANSSLKNKLQKLLTTLENVELREKGNNAYQTLNEILEVMPYLGR